MATIAGASQYLGAATLANTKGLAAQSPTLLGSGGSALSLLDVGRGLSTGSGLSPRARAINESFLNNSANINALLSLTAGVDATVEGLQQQILAIRAKTPTSGLARSLLELPEEENADNGAAAASDLGQTVDEEA